LGMKFLTLHMTTSLENRHPQRFSVA
jgi:hypothetical protein